VTVRMVTRAPQPTSGPKKTQKKAKRKASAPPKGRARGGLKA
jgi:hypothetical protein